MNWPQPTTCVIIINKTTVTASAAEERGQPVDLDVDFFHFFAAAFDDDDDETMVVRRMMMVNKTYSEEEGGHLAVAVVNDATITNLK